MATFDQRQQVVTTQYNADHITIYAQATPRPVDPETLAAAERQLAALPLETIPDPAPLPPGSRMPLRRNPLFVGREADLRALATALKGGETAAIGQTAAISGLGGMGKTQLASEFVHRYGQFFAGGVFWLSFADPAAVPTEVAACGGPGALALHPEFHTLPLADQVQLVQAAWQSPLPRLLVFDNCEDEALLAQWRPPHGGCRVLVTSRRAQWEASLGVQRCPWASSDGTRVSRCCATIARTSSADDTDLEAIAAELGDLPLALHLAGSFLARYRQAITPTAYLAQLRQPDLLAHRSLQGWKLTRELSPTQHEQHVARTFALSYDRLDPADPTDASALALLARAAHFAPGQPIPRDLLLATITGASEEALRRSCLAGRGCPGATAGPRPPRAGCGGRRPAAPLTGGVCAGGCPRCGGPDGSGGRAARRGQASGRRRLSRPPAAAVPAPAGRDGGRAAAGGCANGTPQYCAREIPCICSATMPVHNPPMNAPWPSGSRRWGPTIPTSRRASITWRCSTSPGALCRGRTPLPARPGDPGAGAGARPSPGRREPQ